MARHTHEVTREERVALVRDANDNGCTLDGQRAHVGGYNNPTATVASGAVKVEFAWATVARILSSHRNFQS
jgi:hypothetical protein